MIGSFNFGNIRTNPANAWQGKTTAPGADFESFDTAENGVRAIAKVLQTYAGQGANTLESIISRYSPPTENRTPSLIQAASQRTGYTPDQRLDLSDPSVLDTVTRAIITQEVGNAGPGADVVQRGVKAALPVPTRNVSMLPTPQPAQETTTMATTPNRGLLDIPEERNWLDGLGGLLGQGQTPSQPPGPTMTPGQYQLAGASSAVGQLAGVHDRKVGIGEILGALGGGLTQGAAVGQQAARQQWTDQRQVRADQLAEQDAQSQSALRSAQAQHYMRQGVDPKVVGNGVYENGVWKPAPWAKAGAGAAGPFGGESVPAQLLNAYYTLERKRADQGGLSRDDQLLYDITAQRLQQERQMMTPEGFANVTPAPLPRLGGQPAAPPAAPAPQTSLLDPNAPAPAPSPAPGASPPPAPAAQTGGPTVTTLVPNKAKDIPATAQSGILGNINALRSVENAIASSKAAPDATGVTAGLLNMLPGGVVNKVMPGGTKARADIADIGSLKIHDRSGAAVTVSEFPRLAPFIPSVSDDDATVKTKLTRFREELANEIRDQAAMYGQDQGYRGNPILDGFLKTGRAPRYDAPISGADPNKPANTGGAGSGLSDDDIKRKLGL